MISRGLLLVIEIPGASLTAHHDLSLPARNRTIKDSSCSCVQRERRFVHKVSQISAQKPGGPSRDD